jgi:putative transposase
MFAVKRRLKLNNQEKAKFNSHAGFSRFVYNYGLSLFWQSINAGLKASDTKRLAAIRKCFTNVTKKAEGFEWTQELSSTVYQTAFQSLGEALKRWRKGLSEAPNYKRRKSKRSFTVYDSRGKKLVNQGKSISIPTLGTFRLQEPLKESYVSQTFTLSCEAGDWFVSFSVDAERIPPILHEVVQPVGIDLGVKTFATISDGTEIEAPKPLKKAITKLRKLQCHNRNKRFGDRRTGEKTSNNAKKYFRKLARLHRDIANQRKDFLNKTTTGICQKYAHIHIEDLNVSGMIANRKLSKAISDLGFYEFRRQLTYKAPVFGCSLDVVDRWFPSSRMCRKCGEKHSGLKLFDRTFVCPNCGHTENRDLQASINLANAPDELCSRVGSPRINACEQVAADCLG